MSLSVTVDNGVVRVTGEVDVSNADELRSALAGELEAGAASVSVDLSEVPYIASTAIGVLRGAAHRAAEKNVRFEVANPQRNVERVLGLLGVSAALNVREA